MRLKTVIVESLGRDDLRRVVESVGVGGADRRSAESMRAAIRASRRATAESLLASLGKDSLKAVCAALGVRAAGRREELIERLLTGNGQPQTAAATERERTMSEDAAKPERRGQKGLALQAGNGNGGKLDVPRLENWLWEAACVIRGPVDAPKLRDYYPAAGVREAAVGRVRGRGLASGRRVRERGDGGEAGREGPQAGALLHPGTGSLAGDPGLTEGDGRLRRFDVITANPMWNQKFDARTYENDSFARFGRGIPPSSSADWGRVQHMLASLKDGGRMAVVLDMGAVSRGSGNEGSNKEPDIRREFVEQDLIEAVLLLPGNPVPRRRHDAIPGQRELPSGCGRGPAQRGARRGLGPH